MTAVFIRGLALVCLVQTLACFVVAFEVRHIINFIDSWFGLFLSGVLAIFILAAWFSSKLILFSLSLESCDIRPIFSEKILHMHNEH